MRDLKELIHHRFFWPVLVGTLMLVVAGAFALQKHLMRPVSNPPLPRAEFEAAYTRTLPPPEGRLRVYHLGHSLVGRDMPQMLAELAGHEHASQLGWGTSLAQHWQGPQAIFGYKDENAHPHHRLATEALASGAYDAVIFTEMVELKDAIVYHATASHLAKWAIAAREGNPDVRLYLYETWHRLDDPKGWLERIDSDLSILWEGEVLAGALANGAPPIYLIPGGQVLAAAARAAEAGKLPELSRREDFFALEPSGAQDMIHLNDLGHYLIALTHYAVLYQRSPEGLPAALSLGDGRVVAMDADLAEALQVLVWQVVSKTPRTGITPQ